jgi:GNAT superfamily N-acetyltransferase
LVARILDWSLTIIWAEWGRISSVGSDARNAGIGRQLVEHAVEQARDLGVLCLSVKPVARNKEAIAFFYDAGFRTLGHIQLFMWLGDSFPAQWKTGPELFGKPFEY